MPQDVTPSGPKPAPPNLGRRAVAGAAWITIEQAFVQAVSLVVFAVLAHFLSPHDFGLASICFVLVNTCKIILFDPIAVIVARKAQGTDREYATAFWITLAIAAAAFLGLQLFSLWADRLFDAPGIGTILRAMSAMLIVQGFARTQEVWLTRHFYFRTLALRGGCGALAGGATGIACAALGYGVWALVAQQVVTSLFSFALLWFTSPWRPAFAFCRTTAREILAFAWGMTGGSLAYAFGQNCDTLLIGLFFGPASVGIYNVGKRLRLALQLVAATPVNGVAMPALAEVQNDPARFTTLLLTAIAVVFAVCGPIFLGAAGIAHDAIVLLFGAKWAGAAPIFAWLATAGLLGIVIDYNNNVFVIRNRPAWTLYLALLNIAATLVVFLLLHSSDDSLIALPFVLPYALTLPISIGLTLRLTSLSLAAWLRAVLPPLSAAAAMFLLLRLIEPYWQALPLPLRLAAMVATGAAFYLAALLVVARPLLSQALALIRRRHAPSAA